MTKRIVFSLVCAVIAFGSHAALAADDPPSVGDLSMLTATGPLRQADKDLIRNYLEYWMGRLKTTKKFTDMESARKKIVTGYMVQESAYYQVAYARLAAETVSVALTWPEKAKQILAARALASISQYAVQPALEKMVASKNPAVRYWAARGYRRAARSVMIDATRAKTMLTSLEKLGLQSPPIVIGGVFRALRPFPDVSKGDLAKLRQTLQTVWRARCRDIMAGEVEAIYAYRDELAWLVPVNVADKPAILQSLADLMGACKEALGRDANRKDATVKTLLTQLLTATESQLAAVLGGSARPVSDAARSNSGSEVEHMLEILDAVSIWLDKLAESEFKIKPTLPPPPPEKTATTTTAPA